ncbi:MAG: MFS transporter, partial [Desulfobacteraceae bacterium]|nr:MFS transporter [Desulfobacteraceae bacterium]
FLGALDALIMSAAMPTIIAELSGLHLYAWVYSAYFMARAISLPVFGKLSDLFAVKKLLVVSVTLFILASMAAGAAPSMGFLVAARVFQGIGSGGIFALVYVVLTEAAPRDQRAKTLSLASSIWGISSVIGPTLGGFIVSFFSWRWIFFINLPLGLLSLAGIFFFLREFREKKTNVSLDWAGLVSLTGFLLAVLTLVMTGGRTIAWISLPAVLLAAAALACGAWFVRSELGAKDPILDLRFFRRRGFAVGNLAGFCASFSMFALFGYAPLFLQGALGQTPLQVGMAMLSLSLGWSMGSLLLGRVMHYTTQKTAALAGAVLLAAGTGMTLGFSTATTMVHSFLVFQVVGFGMGFVTLSTLLIVQDSLGSRDLGVATSSHQFARTLGGTLGVGVCGGLVTSRLLNRLETVDVSLPQDLMIQLKESMENLFRPEFQALIPEAARATLKTAVAQGVWTTFVLVFMVSIICFVLVCFLPGQEGG